MEQLFVLNNFKFYNKWNNKWYNIININKIDHYDKIKEIIQDYKCINKCQARWFLELRME